MTELRRGQRSLAMPPWRWCVVLQVGRMYGWVATGTPVNPDFVAYIEEDLAPRDHAAWSWLGIANTHRFKAAHWRAQWEAMLNYDAYAGRGSVAEVGSSVQAQVLSVTCVDDACVDPTSQQELAAAIPAALTLELHGSAGHLNFFTEMETLREATASFLRISGRG